MTCALTWNLKGEAKLRNGHGVRSTVPSSVADPHHVDVDPNPAFNFVADPDHTFHSEADPDSNVLI
jgi:hypothetical protein